MPAITLAYLAFAAGLLLGFGGDVVFGGAAAVLAFAAGWRQPGARLAAAGLAHGAGLLIASAAERADAACSARVELEGKARVRVRDGVTPGRRADGHFDAPWCRVSVQFIPSAADSAVPAGTLVAVEGRGVDRGGRVEFHAVSMRVLAKPGIAPRLRERAGRQLDALYGRHAALARALVIADERSIDPEVREQFADAGIVHMLSVSGLHVAVLAEAVALFFTGLRLPHRAVHLGTLGLVAGYVLVIGAPAPAVRSAVMLGVVRLTMLRQRPTSAWAALALGALLPLIDPRTVLNIGYQLSVAGMAGLIAAGNLSRRIVPATWPPLGRSIARDLLATGVAVLVTAPIVVWFFGRLSLISPATNLLAAPLFGIAQPALFVSLLLAPASGLASVVADGCGVVLSAIGWIGATAGSLRWAAVPLAPDFPTTLALAASTGAFLVAVSSHFYARGLLACTGFAVAAVLRPFLPLPPAHLELHVVDVGQGDAVALRTPHGAWIVVDAGGSYGRTDAGERIVSPVLRRRGGDVALLVLTHPHLDHVGGASSVVARHPPREVWDGARVYAAEAYANALKSARNAGATWTRVGPGTTKTIDGVELSVLAPDSAWTVSRDDPNKSSVVLRVRYRLVTMLLTGDAESDEEGWLLGQYAPAALRADVLKVGHHGSETSSTPEFLAAVKPRVALVSVGVGNRYGHPSYQVLRRLHEAGSEVWRTDDDGTIRIETDGVRLWVIARGDRREVLGSRR